MMLSWRSQKKVATAARGEHGEHERNIIDDYACQPVLIQTSAALLAAMMSLVARPYAMDSTYSDKLYESWMQRHEMFDKEVKIKYTSNLMDHILNCRSFPLVTLVVESLALFCDVIPVSSFPSGWS